VLLLGYSAVVQMLTARENGCLCDATSNNQLDVVKLLLRYPAVKNLMAMDDSPFILVY
jgi:hypothetical protein